MNNDDKTDSSQPDGFFSRLCQCAPVAMIATDADFNVVFCNAKAGELLGSPAEQLVGKSIYQAVPENRRRLLARLLHRTVRRCENSELNIRIPDQAGQFRELAVILSPIPGPDGPPRSVAAWIVDETNRKKLADRLASAEKMASLGTLAGGVAHHFNNILGGVGTFVDYALGTDDPASMRRALQMTVEAAARASKITRALLSFAEHGDSRRTDLADLTEVVLTFSHLVERPLGERGIKLELELHPVPIIAVEANRMHQALGNLLSNAEEAMPQGGTIRLVINRTESDVVLSFADTGCGIEPQHLPLVFEPFFTTKGLLAGGNQANPGLGLSVVHGIILEMGGKISVESEIGKRTKFSMSFPIPAEPTP